MATFYVTQYALTSGIEKVDAEICSSISDRMIAVSGSARPGSVTRTFHKPYWHDTYEAAEAHAEDMRAKKIASHEKSIAKLRNTNFGVRA